MTFVIILPLENTSVFAQEQIIDAQGFSITPQLPASAPEVPEGATYVEINDNIPYFTNEDITSTSTWVEFTQLDELGRVGAANAVLSVDLMPAEHESRLDVSNIRPTGWVQGEYSHIGSGGWLYNRSHLIGHQLAGDGIPELNLMTGTRWFNVDGMLPFENFVAATIEESELTVRYRVTPYFEGGNLLASGVFMEGFSIEDNGETLQFNIFVPNIQEGVGLDYGTGNHGFGEMNQTVNDAPSGSHPGTILYYSENSENIISEVTPDEEVTSYVEPSVEVASEIEATPDASVTGDISAIDVNGNGQVTIQEAKDAGFSMPIYSDHWLYPYMDDRDGDGMVGE